MEVLDKLPFDLDMDELLSRLHIEKESGDAKDLRVLAEAAIAVGRPRAVYEVSYIEEKNYDTVNIGGVVFISRVLRVNLDKVERVFPYIATCGRELDDVAVAPDDAMARYWLDTIKAMALEESLRHIHGYLRRRYALERVSTMSPGSGPSGLWPIEQQKQLFSLFGDVEELIGVRLTESCLMIPNKSVSGICFPTEVSFDTCRLCPRQVCRARRAPYDKHAMASYYEDKSGDPRY